MALSADAGAFDASLCADYKESESAGHLLRLIRKGQSSALEELQTVGHLRPMFRPLEALYRKMQEEIDSLTSEDEIKSGLAAIEWCISHGLTQQAYTLASELFTTAFCLKYGWNAQGKKKKRASGH